MRTRACVTIGAGGLHLDLVELPAHVASTECERDVTMLSELRIGAVAIDLQDAAESCEMLGRACGRAHRRSAASHPTSTPHSARTTKPTVSIVIEGVVATGFCAANADYPGGGSEQSAS